MTVVVLTDCPPKLRGDLTKWLFEVNTGVYVGNLSARVRTELWDRICEKLKTGRATMVFNAAGEQHMDFWVHNTTWEPVDYDGIKLIRRPTLTTDKNSGAGRTVLPEHFSNAAKHQMARRAARTKEKASDKCYAVIDVETTGLNVERDRILEIAALRVENDLVVGKFQSFVRGDGKIPESIASLTGITERELTEKGVPLFEAMQKFLGFIGDVPLVCHNAVFDQKFLRVALQSCKLGPLKNRFIDTLALARRKVRGVPDYKLATLAGHFAIDASQAHRAYADCYITHELYVKLNQL